MRTKKLPEPVRYRLTDRQFLTRVVIIGWIFRLAIVLLFEATDAVRRLHLAPDAGTYDFKGLIIAREMAQGNFNWPDWLDDGWFQFTGFVYYLFGPHPSVVEVINTIIGAVTVIPLFLIFRQVIDDRRTQRFYGLAVAFFPSFVFWQVLALKDAVSILAVAMIVHAIFTLRLRFSTLAVASYVTGMILIAGTRLYLFIVLAIITGPALVVFPYRPTLHSVRILLVSAAVGLLPMAFGYGYFGLEFIHQSYYFDLDYINHARSSMGHGAGALFDPDAVHVWGKDYFSDFITVLQTVLAVFVPVNPFDIRSVRQLMALPLVLAMIYLMLPMFRGFRYAWKVRKLSAPVGLVTAVILAVYVSGTTNAGALFRWTSQIMPYFLMAITVGLFYRPDLYTSRVGGRLVRSWT